MSVFNSLGSNYDFTFVLKVLFSVGGKSKQVELINYLKKRYGGEVILTYKGREALSLALKLTTLPKNCLVGVTGFTCYAVAKAVTDNNCLIKYLDIDPGKLNFTYQTFKSELQKHPDLRVVIIQNTLGYPQEAKKIVELCQEKNIILIEDLAHCVGAVYEDGKEVGTSGDFTVLSFSQDKMIDGISGGALIIRNPKFKIDSNLNLAAVSYLQQLRDRLYPLLTYKIRKTYALGIGKRLHFFLKKTRLLSNPIGTSLGNVIRELPNWYAGLVKFQFERLAKDLGHRRKIAQIYASTLDKSLILSFLTSEIKRSAVLRFPIFVRERSRLVAYLKTKGFYVGDIWYDSPVSPQRYLNLTSYKNDCPHSEEVCSQILNLPTHRNINTTQAMRLAEEVNRWLKQ